jgi:hypothetical protein
MPNNKMVDPIIDAILSTNPEESMLVVYKDRLDIPGYSLEDGAVITHEQLLELMKSGPVLLVEITKGKKE